MTKKVKKALSKIKGISDQWQTSGRCNTLNFDIKKTSQVVRNIYVNFPNNPTKLGH